MPKHPTPSAVPEPSRFPIWTLFSEVASLIAVETQFVRTVVLLMSLCTTQDTRRNFLQNKVQNVG